MVRLYKDASSSAQTARAAAAEELAELSGELGAEQDALDAARRARATFIGMAPTPDSLELASHGS